MDGSQVTGAPSSYARKYALNGLLCLDDTKDSDATNTHGKDKDNYPSASSGEPKQVGAKLVNDKQLALLYAKGKGKEDKVKEIITRYGFTSSKEIVASVFNAILAEVDQL